MQDEFNKTMEEIFYSLKGTGLQKEDFHEDITWEEYIQLTSELADDDKALKNLLHKKEEESSVNKITLYELLSQDFKGAHDTIDKMAIPKRIELLDDIQKYRLHLYNSIATWGQPGIPKEEQLSIKAYRTLMGRIKHLEIIMGWPFGIE